ncbi:MAG: Na(+)-translocating NADH-quinone reductase subunit A [Bacteroidales bacterium]|nr:Na(+)-translocating NADH-quinone reductase subunit A [Bacteroidales bacterium]
MATLIKLKKGYDLNLAGEIAGAEVVAAAPAKCYGVVPDDFTGIIPRMEAKVGDKVAAGDVLYHDKNYDAIKVVSPVSGVVKAVNRGDRRKIESIVIEADNSGEKKKFNQGACDAKQVLLESGLWAMMRQRPYDIVPKPDVEIRDIFVTGFDSAPLAPSLMLVMGESSKYVAKGVEVLKSITSGCVYIGCREGEEVEAPGAETVVISGAHPAGNAGVQAANIAPVNKGETIITLDIVTLARIGELFTEGSVSHDTVVAVTGSEVETPHYVKAIMGCPVQSLLEDNLKNGGEGVRIISGNVLSGAKVDADGFLRAPYRHISVIPELLNKDEFMGWASLSTKKFSVYKNFTHWLLGGRKQNKMDARINGGERAIVMSGEYDRMLPMDIYAEFLIKAIIAFDIDKMEQLGIYEVAPEDFALAEYACTSKLELQRIVREGLDRMRKEME